MTESVLTFTLTVWNGSSSAAGKKLLQSVVKFDFFLFSIVLNGSLTSLNEKGAEPEQWPSIILIIMIFGFVIDL